MNTLTQVAQLMYALHALQTARDAMTSLDAVDSVCQVLPSTSTRTTMLAMLDARAISLEQAQIHAKIVSTNAQSAQTLLELAQIVSKAITQHPQTLFQTISAS
jgi:hypothetical protein